MRLLADLVDYCEQKGLLTPFHVVTVHAKLVLGDGVPRVEAFEKPVRISAPVVKRSGKVLRPYDGYDNEEYVLGEGEMFEAFWTRQKDFLSASGDGEALAAVAGATADLGWVRRAHAVATAMLASKKGSVSHVMLALATTNGLILDRPAVRDHFERDLARASSEDGPDTCLITGKRCTTVRTHANIQNVPGAGAGFPLVSFNQRSSTQPGFEQGLNFPTSLYAMRSYTSALNHLCATQKFDIGPNTCGVVFGPDEAASVAKVLGGYAPQDELSVAWDEVQALAAKEEASQLHVLLLKGTQGRVAILGYSALDARAVASALVRFRDHFQILRRAEDDVLQRFLPTVVARLRAVSPPSASKKNKDAGQALDQFAKVRAIEALLSGEPLPEDALMRIISGLMPSDVVDLGSDNAAREQRRRAANTQIRWFEFQQIIHGKFPAARRQNMADEIERPELLDYGLCEARPGPGDPASELFDCITIGRLIALEEAVTREAHRRRIGGSSLPFIGMSPALWYQDHFRRMRTAVDKLARAGRGGTMFTVQAEKAAAQVSGTEWICKTNPLSARERAAVLLGYTKQDAFVRQHRRWLQQEREKKRSAAKTATTEQEKKRGTTEEAAE